MLFTDYIAEHLSSKGRGGVIVPNGIVATTQNAYVKLRRFLVEDCLVAVISLPSGVFKPYSGVKTSILFFDKQLARQTKEVLFLKITADGFDLGDQRREIEANDLPEAERVVRAWFTEKLTPLANGLVSWKCVAKENLLADGNVVLSAERFTGEEAAETNAVMVRLGDACEKIMDGTHFSPQNSGEGQYRYITAKNIKEMRLALDDITYISKADHDQIYRRCPVKKGDVLYIKDGATTGIAAVNPLEEEFSLLSSKGDLPRLSWRVCRGDGGIREGGGLPRGAGAVVRDEDVDIELEGSEGRGGEAGAGLQKAAGRRWRCLWAG